MEYLGFLFSFKQRQDFVKWKLLNVVKFPDGQIL